MNHTDDAQYLKKMTRSIRDYPKEGIIFRDLTTIFQDSKAFSTALDLMRNSLKGLESELGPINKLAGIEARGFVLAGALAGQMGKGVVLLRKPGKLPYDTLRVEYMLEYGEDALEVHKDALAPGEKIVVIDDLLATGGTAGAACKLVEELGGEVVKVLFLVELPELNGRERLSNYEVEAIISFEGH
jgi:adenine phosphoribosyltransferase